MLPVKRGDHNFVFKGPRSDIGDLSVKAFKRPNGMEYVRTHWKPNEADLQKLNEGGTVELDIIARRMPPIQLRTREADGTEEPNGFRQPVRPHPFLRSL